MPTGIFNTSALPTDLAKKSFASSITRLMPNGQAPLFALTSMIKSETALQIEHGFFTKTMLFPAFTSTAIDASGATTLNVSSTANIVGGMLMRNDRTGEQVLVRAVPSGTTVTVQRAVGTVAAAATTATDSWVMSGNAFEEASTRPTALNIVASRVVNYTQIFRNSWAVSGTNAAVAAIAGGSADAESRQECAAFHATDIEKALILGQKYLGTLNGQPLHTMDGVLNLTTVNAPANVVTLGGTVTPTTWTALEAALDPSLDVVTDVKMGNMRVVFCGGQARRAFHQVFMKNGTYNISNESNDWGLKFSTFNTPRGEFKLIEHPLLNAYGRNSSWSRMALSLDMANFNVAYLAGRQTSRQEYGTNGTPVDNGIDAVGGTLTTEMTCLHKNPAANAVLYNFLAGATG
jgi:hypothetical protein